jgi:hypothetical protein
MNQIVFLLIGPVKSSGIQTVYSSFSDQDVVAMTDTVHGYGNFIG